MTIESDRVVLMVSFSLTILTCTVLRCNVLRIHGTGPHNCFLGGGNEVGSAGGVGNLFEYNTLDNCAFEASDTGAFYSCGQGATAFVNPGNVVRHSTFSNIRSTSEPGVQAITIQVCTVLNADLTGCNVLVFLVLIFLPCPTAVEGHLP